MAAGVADGIGGRWMVLGGGRKWLQLVTAIVVFTLAAVQEKEQSALQKGFVSS